MGGKCEAEKINNTVTNEDEMAQGDGGKKTEDRQ